MRKILLVIFCLVAFANSKEVLNFTTTTNVGPLNPHLYSPNEMFAQDMVYEGLVKYAEDGSVKPWLAKSWNISEDGKLYTFHLRDDVVFSNGEKFDAKAVKANFDAVLNNRKRHQWLELANVIVSCDIIDDYTISLKLKNKYEPTLRELSLVRPFRFIAPSAMIDGETKNGIKAPIGTGVWKLADTKLGISDTFEKNELYYDKKPFFDLIEAKVIPDKSAKVIALKTGEIDLIYGSGQITLDSFNELKSGYDTAVSAPIFSLVLALNSNKFPTNDLSVRKALNIATNKNLIIEKIYYSTQKKADFLFNPNAPMAKIDAKPYEFDIKKANEILENDGWKLHKDGIRYKDGKALNMEFVYIGSDATHKAIAEILQSEFRQIGANLDLKASESTIFYKIQQSGEFNLIFNSTWGAPYGVQGFLASMRTPSHADYQAQLGLKDKAEIDEAITKMSQTLDKDESLKLIKYVLTRLHDEAVYLPITYETNRAVYNKKLKDVEMSVVKYHIPFDKMKF